MMKLLYFTLVFAVISTIALAAPYQELPPKKGYVPVYIREGDTPLSEVNPKLVEAFHEDESAKTAVENKTPEVLVTDANEEETPTKGDDEESKVAENKDDITKADEVKAEETTASDIAEFDNVKTENEDDNVENVENDNVESNNE